MTTSNPTGTGAVSINRTSGTTVGTSSIAIGSYSSATGAYSTALGSYTSATALYSTALGYDSEASGVYSFAWGRESKATGYDSVAFGRKSKATGESSFATGGTASGDYAFAMGGTASGDFSNAFGKSSASMYGQTTFGLCNVADADGSSTAYNALSDALIIGNGPYSSAASNAFRVVFNGTAYGSTYNSTGADYAEYFEWADGNPNTEDRIGHFVALADEGTIKIAAPGEEILGVVSGNGSVIGDSYDDVWQGMWMRDIYGRILYEDVEIEQEDENGEIITVTEHRMKLNPDYDDTREYIPRSQRPEWDAVGMLGKLVVIDDGTCQVNGYCTCGEGGIATAAEEGYRVMSRLDDTHVKVLIK